MTLSGINSVLVMDYLFEKFIDFVHCIRIFTRKLCQRSPLISTCRQLQTNCRQNVMVCFCAARSDSPINYFEQSLQKRNFWCASFVKTLLVWKCQKVLLIMINLCIQSRFFSKTTGVVFSVDMTICKMRLTEHILTK